MNEINMISLFTGAYHVKKNVLIYNCFYVCEVNVLDTSTGEKKTTDSYFILKALDRYPPL